jgi:hypothetical protein
VSPELCHLAAIGERARSASAESQEALTTD